MPKIGLKHYVLVDRKVVAVESLEEWLRLEGQQPDRNHILDNTKVGDMVISTVFLPIDHSYRRDELHEPVVFETMVFGGLMDGEQLRATTYEDAMSCHRLMVSEAHDVQRALDKWLLIATNCDLELQKACS